VLVVNALRLELFEVVLLVDLVEDILESTVVTLKDGVLGGKLERISSVERVLEASPSESGNGLVCVVHSHDGASSVFEGVHCLFVGTVSASIIRNVFHNELARLLGDEVLGHVLVSMSVTTNDDGLGPSWYKLGDVLANNRFSEDGSVQDVSDGSIGGSPHLLQLEFFNSFLIRGNSGALDTDFVFLNSMSSINGDLVIGLISVFNAQIIVLNVKVNVGQDVLFRG